MSSATISDGSAELGLEHAISTV